MQQVGEKNIDVLWEHFINGERGNFSLVYKLVVKNLYLYGLKFTTDKELIQDAIQEVFIEIYSMNSSKQRKIAKLKPYLFISVRNRILKRLSRDSKVRILNDEDTNQLIEFSVEYSAEHKYIEHEENTEVNERLKKSIDNLASKQKEIIYLRFHEELEYTEIAKIMQISVESARKSIYRALQALRSNLDEINKKV